MASRRFQRLLAAMTATLAMSAVSAAHSAPLRKWNSASIKAFALTCFQRPGATGTTQFVWDKATFNLKESALTSADQLNNTTQIGILYINLPYRWHDIDQWSMGVLVFEYSRDAGKTTITPLFNPDVIGLKIDGNNQTDVFRQTTGWPCTSKG